MSDQSPKPPGSSEPPKSSPEKPGSADTPPPKKFRISLIYVAIAIALAILLNSAFDSRATLASYDQFMWHVEQGHVRWVKLGDEYHRGYMEIPEDAPRRPDPELTKPAAASTGGSETADGGESTGGSDGGEPAGGDAEKGASESDRDAKSAPAARAVASRQAIDGADFPNKEKWPLDLMFRVKSIQRHNSLEDLSAKLREHGAKVFYEPTSGFWPVMMYTLPFVLIIAFWFLLMRQSGSMGRAAMSFGRSRAKLQGDLQNVTFKDVAGCEEAIEELTEVVDFLRSPKKYQSLGGRMPKGILLVGPPGTGKTLLARAVAGESKVPFFTLSGSDFVEMFVGVGAARVRDLFQQAKNKAPCIIFVDELDAVGRHRGAGLGGGHDEREQTLNQLLVEMDGFDATKGVIFLAATNRPDVLDPALLRPGRFDRQIVIDAPDAKGREAILRVHARDKPFDDALDFEHLAKSTPGFTGADLANVINEAALLAARRGKSKIDQSDLQEAAERVIAGPERKSRRLGPSERKRVAYHESGHALVAALSEHSDPVRKISIVPRGHAALGYTMQTPEEDRFLNTKSALLDQLKTLLAGRAAEILVFDEESTGAANDLERATRIARAMVCRFGMSEALGPVAFGREQQQVFLGRDFTQEERDYSDRSAQQIDDEVKQILERASGEALGILQENRGCLEKITSVLLEKEVIQGKELDELLRCELGDDASTSLEKSDTADLRSSP